ncbi:MAG: hypothetical protein WC648_02415 [Candidatus Paceibacterota bacterium]|jgi:hypothetical protein
MRYLFGFTLIAIVMAFQFSDAHKEFVLIPGYGIFLHILGGMGVALLASAVLRFWRLSLLKKNIIVLILTLVAGLAWEYWEIYFGLTGRVLWSSAYFIDTLKDLAVDLIGGIAALFFTIKNDKLS